MFPMSPFIVLLYLYPTWECFDFELSLSSCTYILLFDVSSCMVCSTLLLTPIQFTSPTWTSYVPTLPALKATVRHNWSSLCVFVYLIIPFTIYCIILDSLVSIHIFRNPFHPSLTRSSTRTPCVLKRVFRTSIQFLRQDPSHLFYEQQTS